MTRRPVALLVAAAALVACSAPDAPPAPEPVAGTGRCSDGTATAEAFVDSVGVATHLRYSDTPYGDFPLVLRRLRELGVRHVRDGWSADDPELARRARALRAAGIRITFVHDPREGGDPATQHRLVRDHLGDAVEAAESLNEPDVGDGDWVPGALAWTRALSAAYRGDPATADVPVLTPALAAALDRDGHAALAPLRDVVDGATTHDYPGDRLIVTDELLDLVLRTAALAVGRKPVVATETGYSDGPEQAPYAVMSPEVLGRLVPKLLLEHFRRGISRTFLYELLDEQDTRTFEHGFGLVDHDGTPKPSFRNLQDLLRRLDVAAPRCDQPPLGWELEGADASVRALVLRGGTGQWLLVAWRQVQVWNDGRPLEVRPLDLRLRVDNPGALVRPAALGEGGAPTVPTPGGASFPLADGVAVLEVTDAGALR